MVTRLGKDGYVYCDVCGRRCFMEAEIDDLNACSSCDHFACRDCTTILDIDDFPTPFCKKPECQAFAQEQKEEEPHKKAEGLYQEQLLLKPIG